MKFNKKYNISPEFENLFTFKSKEEELEHEAKMIMFRFLSELEKLNEKKPTKKKELAKAIGTSASFVTQLYQGNKLVNLLTLAKLQEAYDITFDIQAKPNSENYSTEVAKTYVPQSFSNKMVGKDGYWIYIAKNPVYNRANLDFYEKKQVLKVA